MAEAFPENHPDDLQRTISVLILATRWTFDTYGLSTVNKSLVNNLRLVDPDVQTIKVTCAVLEENGKISDVELKDAERYGVELVGAQQPMGPMEKLTVKWLDQSPGTYYRYLVKDRKYDFIIGHVPYLANGCFNLRKMCKEKGAPPKVILMVHGLPKNTEGQVDDEQLLLWLSEAEGVFSVGKAVESEIVHYIKGLEENKKPVHKLYIPAYPREFFNGQREVTDNKVQGTQNIAIMTGERKDLDVSGLDFPIAVASTFAASEHIKKFCEVRTNLVMLTATKEDTEYWKTYFTEVLEQNEIDNKSLSFQCYVPKDTDKVKTELRKSNLFLFSSKPDSPLFGTEVLTAVAAGVPILVSQYSGMASLLESIGKHELVVYTVDSESDVKTWKEKILKKLLNPKDSQRKANKLREQLQADVEISQPNLDFTNIVTGEEAKTQVRRLNSLEPREPKVPRSLKLKVTDSEKQSLGYETKTMVSDIDSKPPTDKELSDVASKISPQNMRTLAMSYLGLTQVELDNSSAHKRDDVESIKVDLLIKWRNKNAGKCLQDLLQILQRAAEKQGLLNYVDILDVLELQ